MTNKQAKKIGLIVGKEAAWPDAFIDAVNRRGDGITAELMKLGGIFLNKRCDYSVILDRMSHDIPYYQAYLKFASLSGCYVINNPFISAADDKFLGLALARKLNISCARTVLLPNKRVEATNAPESFRNLEYPMDWDGIIDYVGVPAILKDAHTGGRRIAYRVHNVDELIERYDESDTLNVILQQLLETDTNIHCFVVGQEKVMSLYYSRDDKCYLPDRTFPDDELGRRISNAAVSICRAYGYDINMVEFVIHHGRPYLINPTNPAPDIDRALLSPEQFQWCVDEIADFAIRKAKEEPSQRMLISIPQEKQNAGA